jgi:hypothetical protein
MSGSEKGRLRPPFFMLGSDRLPSGWPHYFYTQGAGALGQAKQRSIMCQEPTRTGGYRQVEEDLVVRVAAPQQRQRRWHGLDRRMAIKRRECALTVRLPPGQIVIPQGSVELDTHRVASDPANRLTLDRGDNQSHGWFIKYQPIQQHIRVQRDAWRAGGWCCQNAGPCR